MNQPLLSSIHILKRKYLLEVIIGVFWNGKKLKETFEKLPVLEINYFLYLLALFTVFELTLVLTSLKCEIFFINIYGLMLGNQIRISKKFQKMICGIDQ